MFLYAQGFTFRIRIVPEPKYSENTEYFGSGTILFGELYGQEGGAACSYLLFEELRGDDAAALAAESDGDILYRLARRLFH